MASRSGGRSAAALLAGFAAAGLAVLAGWLTAFTVVLYRWELCGYDAWNVITTAVGIGATASLAVGAVACMTSAATVTGRKIIRIALLVGCLLLLAELPLVFATPLMTPKTGPTAGRL